jgi:hypothetical protein
MCGQRQRRRWVTEIYLLSVAVITHQVEQVNQDQLTHVQRGCLARRREDIRVDGSRIEGSHKGWNSLQRAQPSGVVVLTALCHDFVLRRNIRIGFAGRDSPPTSFVASAFGSHHIRLVDNIASLWNSLLTKQKQGQHGVVLTALPRLPDISSGETFGVVDSEHAATFGGMLEMKIEPEDDNISLTECRAVEHIKHTLHVDPALLLTSNSTLSQRAQTPQQLRPAPTISSLSSSLPGAKLGDTSAGSVSASKRKAGVEADRSEGKKARHPEAVRALLMSVCVN